MSPTCKLIELGYFVVDMGQEYHDEMWAGKFRWENRRVGEIQVNGVSKSSEAAWADCQAHVAKIEASRK